MKKNLLIVALVVVVPTLACAKKPKQQVVEPVAEVVEQVEEEVIPEVTDECLAQVSMFTEYCKAKAYHDAFEPWLQVYQNCPTANKAIYSRGSQILEYEYANAKDDAARNQIRALAMEMYDKRIKYYGNDVKYPKAYILGQKGVDYCAYFPEDNLKLEAYGWLKESVASMGYNSQLKVLRTFAEVSNGLYKADPEKYGEQYIADYSQVSNILQYIWNDPTSKNASDAAVVKEYVDNLFAVSGAASCDKMDELYRNYVVSNGQYLEDMLKLMAMYKRVKCTESEVYFAAAAAAHQLRPTEESAAGCAKMSAKKEDWNAAIDYYKQALELIEEELDDDRDDYLYGLAYCYYNLHRYADARSYARQSIEVEPTTAGRSYILVGLCYAASQPYSAAESSSAKAAILNKTVFWAAVDQFTKAKQYDDCVEDANKLIAAYSKYFPTKEEMFDLPGEFGSGSFVVGGWIGERTICRPAK